MDGLVRLWSMTALEAARASDRERIKPVQEPDLPARLGKAGAWARWMAQRDLEGEPTTVALPYADGAKA